MAHTLNEVGLLRFEIVGDPVILEVHVFSADKYEGMPIESEGGMFKFLYKNRYMVHVETIARFGGQHHIV